MAEQPLVTVTRRLPSAVEDRLKEFFNVRLNDRDMAMSRTELELAMSMSSVLVSTITDQIDAQMIAQRGPQLRLIAQFGNGVDNIDVAAAQRAGILVTNTPSVLTEDTADMTLALMLAAPRRLVEGTQLLLNGTDWSGWSPTHMLGQRIAGRGLGIVGMGRIGMAVARRAKAFGLKIHYFSRTQKDPALEAELEATFWPDLEAMLEEIDFVSLHCPLTQKTEQMLNADRLAKLHDRAYVINVSRPELIDEPALIQSLENGQLGGAALDVFDNQQGLNPRLVQLAKANKVLLSAHMGSSTVQGREDMGRQVVLNINEFLQGRTPPHVVWPQ